MYMIHRLIRANVGRLHALSKDDFSGLILSPARRPREGSSPRLKHTAGVHRRLLLQVLHGASDANIRFSDPALLLRDLGFQERVRGSHHISPGKASRKS
jgi:hypothetical protein